MVSICVSFVDPTPGDIAEKKICPTRSNFGNSLGFLALSRPDCVTSSLASQRYGLGPSQDLAQEYTTKQKNIFMFSG